MTYLSPLAESRISGQVGVGISELTVAIYIPSGFRSVEARPTPRFQNDWPPLESIRRAEKTRSIFAVHSYQQWVSNDFRFNAAFRFVSGFAAKK